MTVVTRFNVRDKVACVCHMTGQRCVVTIVSIEITILPECWNMEPIISYKTLEKGYPIDEDDLQPVGEKEGL